MEPAITERVGDSSRRRSRPPRKHFRKSLAESPPSLPRSSQRKRKRKETSSAEYYSVRQILDEKTEHGEVEYLIDWEDNPRTGESYPQSWEPHDNVNRQAIDEWVERQDQAKRDAQRRIQENKSLQSSSSDLYLSSEPVRTTKRQRTKRPTSTSSSSQPPAKKPRRAGTVQTARFQSVSQETLDSAGKPEEIKDSYEDDQSLSNGSGRIRVEIPVDQRFDREAYAIVSVASSEFSQSTQPSKYSQSSRPSYTQPPSQFKTPTRHRFLWDEEDDGAPIIPDSQDLPGPSSYKPIETPTSQSGATTQTTGEIEAGLATRRYNTTFKGPGDIGYRPSKAPSYLSGASSLGDESQAISSQVDPNPRPSRTSVEESQEDHHLHQSSVSDSVEKLELSASSRARPEAAILADSSHLPSSSDNNLPSLTRGSWPQEAAHIPSQAQTYQPSSSVTSSDSQLQFQSLFSTVNQDENISQTSNLHVRQGSHNDNVLHSRQSAPLEISSHILGRELPLAISGTPFQRSVSSFEATQQASQIRSISPRSYSQDAQIIPEEEQSCPLAEYQAVTSQAPSLNNLDANIQRCASKPQDLFSSKEEPPLPPHPNRPDNPLDASENVLQSIETVFEIVSSAALSRPSPLSSGVAEIPGNYPQSPRTSPSNIRMADQAMGEMSIAEQLKAARLAAAEKRMAQQREARTASAIPHTPPAAAPPAINQMLPLRENATEAPVVNAPSPKASPERETSTTSLQILPLGEHVYMVPLPMASLARDIYDQEITNHRSQRRSFLNDDEIDTRLLDHIDMMIERLKKICDHQDLIDDNSATQQMEADHLQARWAENISTKCMFLAGFFNSLRSINTHILILARPGRMMDILEALIRSHDYIYTRPDRPSTRSGQGLLKISLLPTDVAEHNYVFPPASMVIVFDSTFENSSYVKSIRTNSEDEGRIAPLVHLVINHSIEHLELCFERNLTELDRKALLVNSISHVREEVGKLDAEYLSPEPAAKAVADFLVDGASGEWPLLPMPYIEGIEPVPETSAGSNSAEAQPSGSTTQSYDLSPPAAIQPAFKRPLLDEEGSESSKRQRLTPVLGVSSSGVDISREDETILNTSTGAENSGSDTAEKQEIDAKASILSAYQEDQVSLLVKRISELESQLRSKEEVVADLGLFKQRAEVRCQDYEKSIKAIQPKYQEALNERGQAQHNIRESIAREANMRQKLDARTAEATKLREEKGLADAALIDARQTLSSSSIPEVAELQGLKNELNKARAETEKFQRKLISAQNDMEYLRNNYQKASSAAAEMRTELEALKSLNETLSRKASANAVDIHRIQASSEIKQHLQRISELEGEKAELERELEKKTDELKTVMNGRRPTRGTSVPRSPHMGTMSPGQNSRPMARVLSGVNSRGNSPAPGGAEGIRGPAAFGDALFPPVAGNRWGNHLS